MTNTRQLPSLDWEDVRFFIAISRHGTLLGAARNLRVPPEAVVRRLDSLETTLGFTLFTRNASVFTLNAAGAAALAEAAQMEMAACSLTQKRAWYR
jgi:DNA-binding transcriptional LysR family regulator